MYAEVNGRQMQVQGELTNISPIRNMSYYVTVVTDTGTFADWHLHNVRIGTKAIPLKPQTTRRLQSSAGGPGRSFRLLVRSVPAVSAEAKAWAAGHLPQIRIRRI